MQEMLTPPMPYEYHNFHFEGVVGIIIELGLELHNQGVIYGQRYS